ncbi:MAG TPA: flagellar biosynthetic protein FliR [Candidatus Goldiibacteriota bacterium]|nr:flagellar biosynthetic protein FliR [Candidatus Goldiibacteriota bacterium]
MLGIDIFNLALLQLQIFLLEFIRISSIFLTAPIIGSRNIPLVVKISFAFILTLLIYPVFTKNYNLPVDLLSYSILIFKQILVGIIIGFLSYLVFIAIQLAGQIIDLQMGFGIVNVIDPLSNTQVSIIGQFQFILGVLIFLALDGHHFLFKAIVDSFNLVPLTSVTLSEITISKISFMFFNMFVIAFKIAGPATLALFLTNVTLGFIARTIPQIMFLLLDYL